MRACHSWLRHSPPYFSISLKQPQSYIIFV
jgi:hypothetical protein